MKYLTRSETDPPATLDQMRDRWAQVDSLRIVQSILARDLVKLRRQAEIDASLKQSEVEHEVGLALVSIKLEMANIAFFETQDALRHASAKPNTQTHTHERPG